MSEDASEGLRMTTYYLVRCHCASARRAKKTAAMRRVSVFADDLRTEA